MVSFSEKKPAKPYIKNGFPAQTYPLGIVILQKGQTEKA
jgi:hypothetical protein